MSNHSPFPWKLVKAAHGTFLMSGTYCIHRVGPTSADEADAQLMTTIPGLLMAAMRGHGWGDPLHIEAHPNCTMCHAIRIAVGERTAKRVLELAKMNSDHVLELLDADGASDEENWGEVERLLGIANGDPYCAELRAAGEYEGMDVDIIEACSNA